MSESEKKYLRHKHGWAWAGPREKSRKIGNEVKTAYWINEEDERVSS